MFLKDAPFVRYALFAASVIFGSLVGATSCSGQKAAELRYRLICDGMSGSHGEKVVITAIKDQDPGATVSASSQVQQVKVITIVQLDREMLSAALAAQGITLVNMVALRADHDDTRSAMDLPGFPEYIDTGNEEADQVNYRLRKQAWIEAHPEFSMPAGTNK